MIVCLTKGCRSKLRESTSGWWIRHARCGYPETTGVDLGAFFGGERICLTSQFCSPSSIIDANHQTFPGRSSLHLEYKLLDPSVVRVPFVHRFITRRRIGYILVEYIQGQVIAKLESPQLISRNTRMFSLQLGACTDHRRVRADSALTSDTSTGQLFTRPRPPFLKVPYSVV